MISLLVGEVVEVDSATSAVFLVSGVGYQVNVLPSDLVKLQRGLQWTLFVRMLTKEDGSTLFGFLDRLDRSAFDLLRRIQGIGPSVAMALLGAPGRERLWVAIEQADLDTVCLAPGVGRKLAQRIITELSGRLPAADGVTEGGRVLRQTSTVELEVSEALKALGFDGREIEAAIAVLPEEVGVSEAIRLCLRAMAR